MNCISESTNALDDSQKHFSLLGARHESRLRRKETNFCYGALYFTKATQGAHTVHDTLARNRVASNEEGQKRDCQGESLVQRGEDGRK